MTRIADIQLGKARALITVEVRGEGHLKNIPLDLAEKEYDVKMRLGI